MLAIKAVATELDIKAAVAGLPADIKRLAATADLAIAGKVTVGALDAKLAASRLSTHERLTLKVGLDRSGLLVD